MVVSDRRPTPQCRWHLLVSCACTARPAGMKVFSVEIKIAVGGMSERIPEMKSIQGYSDGDKINS